jgi:hypothetical protein
VLAQSLMLAVSRSGGTAEVVMRGKVEDFHFRIRLRRKTAENLAIRFPAEPRIIGSPTIGPLACHPQVTSCFQDMIPMKRG